MDIVPLKGTVCESLRAAMAVNVIMSPARAIAVMAIARFTMFTSQVLIHES